MAVITEPEPVRHSGSRTGLVDVCHDNAFSGRWHINLLRHIGREALDADATNVAYSPLPSSIAAIVPVVPPIGWSQSTPAWTQCRA